MAEIAGWTILDIALMVAAMMGILAAYSRGRTVFLEKPHLILTEVEES
jgi:hypothetical protein